MGGLSRKVDVTRTASTSKLSEESLGIFDRSLLKALGCLKALNFRHIAFLGRGLDEIQRGDAYKILWHKIPASSDITFGRLQKLCNKGWVTPWYSWKPDHILTEPRGQAQPKKNGVLFVLGREGRRRLREKSIMMPPAPMDDDLYLTAFPLARWMTASSCALTLQSQGYELRAVQEEWKKRFDIAAPAFKPDFIAFKGAPIAFYIYESPFGVRSEYFVAHVGRGLHWMSSGSSAVILIRSKEALRKVLFSMKGNCLGENGDRVFVGNLEDFRDKLGHSSVVSGNNKFMRL